MRLIAVLLALLLPLQLSWAVVGEFCQHESAPREAQHFGHHAHAHKAEATTEAGKDVTKSGAHGDCDFCHAGSPATMSLDSAHVPELAMREARAPFIGIDPPSALARAPDRPQWLRLA